MKVENFRCVKGFSSLRFSLVALALLLFQYGSAIAAAGEAGSLNASLLSSAQDEKTVSGVVTDASGEPLIAVSVVVKGTTIGTATDFDGNFHLVLPEGSNELEFLYLGFRTETINVSGKKHLSVVMHEDTQALDELVVTALGIKRSEKALSYNVQQVSGDDLSTVKSANFMNSLAGKVAGVNVNSGAAGPGAAVKVVMRGAKSISKDNNALYVIDGVPMYNSNAGNEMNVGSMSSQPGTDAVADINPDDIESMSLLTGPSAAALYGADGANGVVLITTKKGAAGRTRVTISNSTTFSSPFMMPKFQNRYGNIEGETLSWGDKTDFRFEPVNFFQTGTNISNTVSLSTGTDKNQTYLSASTNNSAGIVPNNAYNRYNFSFRNTSSFLNDKFVLDVSANYIIQENKNMISQGQYFNPLPALYLFPRAEDFTAVQNYERYNELMEVNDQFWIYGDQGISMQNPYWIMNKMNRESSRRRYKLLASLQYNVTDWLNIVARANIDNSEAKNTQKRHAGTLYTFSGPKGFYSQGLRNERQTYADIIANINKTFNDFTITANIGSSIKDLRTDSHMTSANLGKTTNWFTTENYNRNVGSLKFDDSGILTRQVQSLFASAELGYKHFLYLTLTNRTDWDSALAFSEAGDNSFSYPSVGLSGIISEFVKLPNWFTFLKTRLSFTRVGSSYPPYLTKEYYVYNGQTDQFEASKLYPNKFLKPEQTDSYEAGINMRFFNGALNVDATYYRSNTYNQTFIAKLAGISGYDGINVQAGDVQNSGIELALGYNKDWKNFSWSSNLTYTYNENKVNKLADGVKNRLTGEPIQMPHADMATLGGSGSPIVRLTEGGSMGDIYVNRDFKRDDNGYIFLDPTTFLPTMVDTDYKKLGSLLPKTNIGFRNSFTYKGLRLNTLISARIGGLVVSNTQAFLDRYGVSEYSAKLRENNPIINGKVVPAKDFLNVVAAGTGQGSHYVYDATNVRLQEISLEYTVPRKWVGNFADITLGLVGNNLALIYCKAPFDPELVTSASSTYYTGVDYFMMPSLRNMGFSVKLQF